MRAFLWIFGLGNIANAIWMLVAPEAWYHELPAGVPDTGPLNLHFVRDIGAAYATTGLALCAGAEMPQYRRAAIAGAAVFLGLHAAIHVFDLVTGLLPATHWIEDLPGVFFPALLLAVLSLPRWWRDTHV
jgi:hypothetical protein